ncbi:MAG: UDP-glucuronate decarboxylase [Bradymonadia bacterium]|jgi:UDP-glucuronate decarboxylase
MQIAVTGGAGFLGSHLCEALLARGHHVICVDNFFTGSIDNVAHLKAHPHFELVRHDIVEPILLEVDQVYNLACPASPVHYQYNPVKTVKTNVVGTLNMLGLAKRVRGRLMQASTSEVYGDPLVHPQTEDYWGNVNPIGPRSCYDEGKRVAETLCHDYRKEHGVDARIVRIFNTYGPRTALNDGRVVSNFITQALTDTPITIFGKGDQTRSFCYVSDLIRGFLAMMDAEVADQPVNLGNPNETSILELAETIVRMTNSKSKIAFEPLPVDDPVRRKPDITRARTLLGWEPQVSLEEGLSKTINDIKSRLS